MTNSEIAANGYKIAASSYVEQRDDRAAVDITALNAEIARMVARQSELRLQIDAIVADLEGVREVSSPETLPDGYPKLLMDIHQRVRHAQVRAVLAVNAELIRLYWEIGRLLDHRQRQEGWGSAVIPRLSRDLHNELPEVKGFSERNIKRMLAFYRAYPKLQFVPQLVAQIDAAVRGRKPVEIFTAQLVQSVPWGHHAELIAKVKDPATRHWYMQATVQNGWSRNVLTMQIESGAHHRQGKAVSNFSLRLPSTDSDLVQQALKDPYLFDFLTLEADFHERELETGLIAHLEKFLLELGRGFAFVGRQYHLDIGEQDFYIDLLFYHLELRRYMVIDLKRGDFKPEYAGKMNFYCNVVDDRLRHATDNPTIGLILCQQPNRVLAEYALRGMDKPIGVSSFELTRALPHTLQSSLPSIEEIERELQGDTKMSRIMEQQTEPRVQIDAIVADLERVEAWNKFIDKAKESLFPSPIPTWEGFSLYVLRYLNDGDERGLSEIRQGVADLAGLTDSQRAEQVSSGQLRLDNRIGWAISKLNRVGAIERPARARYRITTKGKLLLAAHPNGITEEILRTVAKSGDEWWNQKGGSGTMGTDVTDVEKTEPLDPMEQIALGVNRINSDVAADLLQRLQAMDPYIFERAVIKLMTAMGYGGNEWQATVTQKSNDGGIDGIIDLDALGINRMYIQAKRYSSTTPVHRPAVQGFVGAISGKANTGVFITTGQFSPGALEYAAEAHTRVILIDGTRLTELMIQYGVGVQSQTRS